MTATRLPSVDSAIGRGPGPGAAGGLGRFDIGLLAGLAILSAGLLFWATRDGMIAAGFLAGLAVAAGAVVLLRR
ncbi:MAG TPA: hypothetical protein PKC77_07600, partial [Sphingopyxis sp.]|nr:hypothetical protein [Sphingopyxis sp.]